MWVEEFYGKLLIPYAYGPLCWQQLGRMLLVLVATHSNSRVNVGTVQVLIRVVDASSYSLVRRAIDLGCCGLLLPTVETVEALDIVRDSIWMPPRGKRRPGGWGNNWVKGTGGAPAPAPCLCLWVRTLPRHVHLLTCVFVLTSRH